VTGPQVRVVFSRPIMQSHDRMGIARQRQWVRWVMAATVAAGAWSCAGTGTGTSTGTAKSVAWTYGGDTGPARWGDLSSDYKTCSTGRTQSPVDLAGTSLTELEPAQLHYDGLTTSAVFNGHAIQLSVDSNNWMMVDGKRATLAQVHLHSPSEHLIRGERFPLEAHFVHTGEAGNLTVVGVMFRAGEADPSLEALAPALAGKAGEATPVRLRLADLVSPDVTAHFRYEGSLTTPPCSEGVAWYVAQQPRSASPDQIAAFVRVTGDNARPVQPLQGRQVRQSR
jgi:carbonic anhydrase